MTDSVPPLVARPAVWPFQAVVGVLLALKLIYFGIAPPIGDEAYYWLWGQRPSLSYLDHPPLHAWLLGLMSQLFGWNLFSLRALTWLTLATTIWVIWRLSRRLAPDHARQWFWAALAIYLASPLMFVMGSISFNDHLLVALCLLSALCFLDFADDWRKGMERFGRLYLAAIFLGLAILTKYNGALLGFGYLGFVLVHPAFRPLLRRWQTYAAATLSLALQAPVIYWNLTDGLASYKFHLVDRWNGAAGIDPVNLLLTIFLDAFSVSFFVIVPMLRLYRGRVAGYPGLARLLAATVLAVSTVTILVIATIETDVPTYWNIVGYPLALIMIAGTFRSRWGFWLHAVSGTLLIGLFMVNILLVPVRDLVGWSDGTTFSNYDWDKVAAIVATAHAAEPAAFLAATRYTTAAQLAFALRDPAVTDISDRHTQFNYWFDPKAHIGQNALLLVAPLVPIDFAATQFRKVTLLQTIEIRRFGRLAGRYPLYRGEGYCGGTCP
jgi:4-amino-4-deoxy-L-arabinose transferase-like glycosyltransferase